MNPTKEPEEAPIDNELLLSKNITLLAVAEELVPGGKVRVTVVAPSIAVHKLKAITCQSVVDMAAKLAVITEVIWKVTASEVLMDNVLLDNKAPPAMCLI